MRALKTRIVCEHFIQNIVYRLLNQYYTLYVTRHVTYKHAGSCGLRDTCVESQR